MPFVDGTTRYYQFESLTAMGVTQAVFTRRGGVSSGQWQSLNVGSTVGDDLDHVHENRKRIFQSVDRSLETLFDVWQVHSKVVVKALDPRPLNQAHVQADGMHHTNKLGVTLLMRFADCVPILLADPVKKVVGMAHAGWQGTVIKVAAETIHAMQQEFGCSPADIRACIGPSIGPDHYEVGEDVAQAVRASFGEEPESLLVPVDGKYKLDLWKANELVLHQCGVTQIERADICTACHLEDWYSHRAEGGKTGRFGALIALGGVNMIDTAPTQIREQFQTTLEKMHQAARRCGRDPGSTRLVVVTKGQSVEKIRAVIEAGAQVLGENYAEQVVPKIEALKDAGLIEWHMIGHIQSRKAAMTCQYFHMIHSLDQVRLADRLDRLAVEYKKKMPVLLEVNVGVEETKYGWPIRDELDYQLFMKDIEAISTLQNLKVAGLMSMPPLTENAEDSRPYFQKVRHILDRLKLDMPLIDWHELSFGTSADYEIAVEEGATYVRVGTAIMGPRVYNDMGGAG